MDASRIMADLSLDDVMQAWPETLRVFLRRRMACVGCEVAPLHTLGEAARIYGVPADVLVAELHEAARTAADQGGPARGVTLRRRGAPARAGRGPRSAAVPP